MAEQLALFDLTAPSLPPDRVQHDCNDGRFYLGETYEENESGELLHLLWYHRRTCGREWSVVER